MMMNDIYRKSVLLFVSKMHVCMALVPVIAATLVLVLQRQEINIQGGAKTTEMLICMKI
jgi:hypothetical protein